MTTKEYLQQAYRLDKRINSHIREKEELMQMATSVSSPQWKEDVVQTSKSGDAPFCGRWRRCGSWKSRSRRRSICM